MLLLKFSYRLFMGAFSVNAENRMLTNMSNICLHRKYITDIHERGKARENVYFRKRVCIRIAIRTFTISITIISTYLHS